MSKEIIYIDFIRAYHPKVSWVMEQLQQIGVPCRIHGESMHGKPVLQIEKGLEGLAMEVTNQVVGELHIGAINRAITIMDLADTHEFFHNPGPPSPDQADVVVGKDNIKDYVVSQNNLKDIEFEGGVMHVLPDAPVIAVPKSTHSGKTPVDVPKKDPLAGGPRPVRQYGPKPDGPILAVAKPPAPVELDGEWDDDDWGDDPTPANETIEEMATRLIRSSEVMIMIDPVKSATVRMYEINSSHMSSMGSVPMFSPAGTGRWVFVSFKGGKAHYRYCPVNQAQWEELLTEAINNVLAKDGSAPSVGKAFWSILRDPAEAGKIVCERYDDHGVWVSVPAKDPALLQKKRDR